MGRYGKINCYSIEYHENGLISAEQHTIGNYVLSFNPDWDRFCVSIIDDPKLIATFAGNAKGFQNAVYWIKRKNRPQMGE